MPDRRRQRQQRVRQEAGDDPRSVGASNREQPVKEEPPPNNVNQQQKKNPTGVSYAEPKEYESVTIMPDKEKQEPQKYQRREILSNWLRYEDLPPEDATEDGEDYLVGEDFSAILEQQVSSGGHLMLKGENLLDDNETNILKCHGLGSLHVADLVAAINTIPLQTQLNIPESALPDAVLQFYSDLAADNKKIYQPSNNYNDCLDVNEKILQSLKLSENEPLNLTAEVPVAEKEALNKNAVDVALSLSSAFEPEPDDVDLDLLVREPTPEKSSEAVAPSVPVKEPSPQKEPSPLKEPSPVKEPTPKETTPVKEPSPAKEPTPVKELTPVKEVAPSQPSIDKKQNTVIKEASPEKQPSPAPLTKNQNETKEKSPTFNFGLPKPSASNLPTNFGLPKTGSDIQTNAVLANALKDVDLGNSSNVEGKAQEGPTIDLDAPIAQTKPVLLLSKTEEEDLEDWLDSVLDD